MWFLRQSSSCSALPLHPRGAAGGGLQGRPCVQQFPRARWLELCALPLQRGVCWLFLVQLPRGGSGLWQLSRFLGAALRSSFTVPLVLYSVAELLCSLGVVKTVNTGVTQRINGNDMRLVLMDDRYFSPAPAPAPLGWKTQCLRAAANKHLCWTWAWLCSGAVSPCPPPSPWFS